MKITRRITYECDNEVYLQNQMEASLPVGVFQPSSVKITVEHVDGPTWSTDGARTYELIRRSSTT